MVGLVGVYGECSGEDREGQAEEVHWEAHCCGMGKVMSLLSCLGELF